MKILIVEDELFHANEMADWLKTEGYKVLNIAKSGERALEIFQEEQPDLMIVDIQLKGKMNSGIQLMQKVQKQREIAFFYLTNNTSYFEEARNTNPHVFLGKSEIKKESLLRHVEMALHHFRQRKHPESQTYQVTDGIFIYDHKQKQYTKLSIKDICWFEADRSYTNIRLINEAEHIMALNLSTILGKIDFPNIIRINQRYAINLDNVTTFRTRTVHVGGMKVEQPISDLYCPDFANYFMQITTCRKN